MGARNSKLRQYCCKALKERKEALRHRRSSDDDDATAQLIASGSEDEKEVVEMLQASSFYFTDSTLDELDTMQQQINTLSNAFRERLDVMETEHRQKLQHCAIRWRNFHNSSAFVATSGRQRRKLESLTEECRLRNSFLSEKIRNCSDYLQTFDTLIHSIQHEQKRKSDEEDDFLREFLLKSARNQHRKGQICQAVDTFCQLLLATGGHLRATEMEVLADICREKIRHTREFHERVSQTIRQVCAVPFEAANKNIQILFITQQQLNEASNTVRDQFVVQELWGQVLEDLRADCAESFEIVMQVKTTANGRNEQMNNYAQKQHNIEQLKLLMASTVSALWLHITPREHEEFDDIKGLFFQTLDDYIETFRIKKRKNLDKNCHDAFVELEKNVRELMGNYPTVASTRKMRKIAQRIYII